MKKKRLPKRRNPVARAVAEMGKGEKEHKAKNKYSRKIKHKKYD
jgi:hypothetical protein